MKTIFLSLTIFLVSASCGAFAAEEAALSEKAANRLAAFERTGDIASCINVSRIRSIKALDAEHFLIRAVGGDYYLNVTSGCSGAGRANNRIQYSLTTPQLCRNQIVTVIDNTTGMTAGACGLGAFERLEKKAP